MQAPDAAATLTTKSDYFNFGHGPDLPDTSQPISCQMLSTMVLLFATIKFIVANRQ